MPLRRSRFAPLFASVMLIAGLVCPGAQPATEPYRLAPDAAIAGLAAAPDPLGAEDLLAAALAFSGASGDRLAQATRIGLEDIAAARELAAAKPDPYRLGELILGLVHRRIKTYSLLESRMDYALIEGRYNCVGASSLYAILATAAGLPVHGVVTPDHAYCYLTLPGRTVDVETTSANGYDDSATRRTAPGDAVEVRGLLALALRNRATLLERGGRWAEALGLTVDAYVFVSRGSPPHADGDSLTWQALAGRLNNTVSFLLSGGRYADALALVDEATGRWGNSPEFAALRTSASTAALLDAVRKARPEAAVALVDQAALSGGIEAEWLQRAYAYAYAAWADAKRAAGDHRGAWDIAAQGASRFPASAELVALESTARTNWVRSVHNAFAALYNAGKYQEALEAIEAATLVAPGERLLADDAAAARRALSSGQS